MQSKLFSPDQEKTFADFKKLRFVAHSKAMLDVFDEIKMYKDDINVLITGETGTGKELVAGALKELSSRRRERFVIVNCGAITPSLIDGELFGAKKGAYSDAKEDRKGYFEEADGGTIFLDEVGELSKEAQVKLLRVVEYGEYNRLGDPKKRKVDVRVIVATNKDLKNEINEKRFREDLFYRLEPATINVPPLRERMEEIAELSEYFLKDPRGGIVKDLYKTVPFHIGDSIVKPLKSHVWPGNVRELRNRLQRIYARNEKHITKLKPWMLQKLFENPNLDIRPFLEHASSENSVYPGMGDLNILYTFFDKELNLSSAARALGINRDTARSRINSCLLQIGHKCGFNVEEIIKYLEENGIDVQDRRNIGSLLDECFTMVIKHHLGYTSKQVYYDRDEEAVVALAEARKDLVASIGKMPK